jgi:hypothetical protein
MFKTQTEKANFVRNVFSSVEFALSKIDNTQFLGMPVKSIMAPNSKYEICISWDEEHKLLRITEACMDGKCADIDFDKLTNGQLDDFLSTTMMLFNCIVKQVEKEEHIGRCDLCGHCFKCCGC